MEEWKTLLFLPCQEEEEAEEEEEEEEEQEGITSMIPGGCARQCEGWEFLFPPFSLRTRISFVPPVSGDRENNFICLRPSLPFSRCGLTRLTQWMGMPVM